MAAVEFARVNATDFLQKGAVYRVTYERSPWLGWLATSTATNIWNALEGADIPVFRVSPKPNDGAVAVIDVKARTDAPTQSVGQMVNSINQFANWSITRVEMLGSEGMSTKQAADARTSLTTQREAERGIENPLNRLFDVFGAVKWVAVAAIIGAGVYLFVKYGPKPKRRGRQ